MHVHGGCKHLPAIIALLSTAEDRSPSLSLYVPRMGDRKTTRGPRSPFGPATGPSPRGWIEAVTGRLPIKVDSSVAKNAPRQSAMSTLFFFAYWEERMNRYIAELVGTFMLVFCGVGAALIAGDKIGVLGISLAFGLTLLAMAYAIGPISGCHINPAVTIGMADAGRCKWSDVIGYVIAQVIGGIAGAGALLLIHPDGMAGVANTLQGNYGMFPGFLTEALLTMLLVLTVIGSTSKNAPAGFAGVPIGLALAVTNFVAIPVTNASINPARSIGPALYSGGGDAVSQLWLFIVAPIVGGIVAALVYQLIQEKTA